MKKNSEIWLSYSGVPELYKDSSFDNYERVMGNKKQEAAFTDMSQNLKNTIMLGGVGTGKTHLACAKVTEVIGKGYQAMYIEMIKLIREIKQSWNDRDIHESDVINKYGRDIAFLVIDEIGVQFGSETEMQYLTEIINDRYNNKLKTYLISNASATQLIEIVGERVIDRFKESGAVYMFDWESHRA